jgi:hypothetical protein
MIQNPQIGAGGDEGRTVPAGTYRKITDISEQHSRDDPEFAYT